MIGVEMEPVGGGRWRTTAVFLSAHCFADPACRWYRGAELRRFRWVSDSPGAPVVWVARGSNASYPSPGSCDGGHYSLDSCDHHDVTIRFPITSTRQNLGSRSRPFLGAAPSGCIPAENLPRVPRGAVAAAEECFWSEVPFRGWSGSPAGDPPTPYAAYLREVLGW